jgi:primosomal replication protein N
VKPGPNQFYLTAQIAEVQAMRFTPDRIPSLSLILAHESEVQEAVQARQVRAEFKAVAFGAVAEQLAVQTLGSNWNFLGFLAQARLGKQLVFHIQQFSSD